ncbi:hypothetical protein TOPH_07254, partial [Tolypocladium ophioglossoides CBS 100239]
AKVACQAAPELTSGGQTGGPIRIRTSSPPAAAAASEAILMVRPSSNCTGQAASHCYSVRKYRANERRFKFMLSLDGRGAQDLAFSLQATPSGMRVDEARQRVLGIF